MMARIVNEPTESKFGKSIENHVHLQCTFQKNLEDFLKS